MLSESDWEDGFREMGMLLQWLEYVRAGSCVVRVRTRMGKEGMEENDRADSQRRVL